MRFRRRTFRKGPREPVNFERFPIAGAGTAFAALGDGTTIGAGFTVFDPTAVVVGAQDLRLTVIRLRLMRGTIVSKITGGTAAAGDIIAFFEGILMTEAGSPTTEQDPAQSNAASQRADWLYLGQGPVALTAALPSATAITNPWNEKNALSLIDVKSKRKLDQGQILKYIVGVKTTTVEGNAHTVTAGTLNGVAVSSVLYQRTMRHR